MHIYIQRGLARRHFPRNVDPRHKQTIKREREKREKRRKKGEKKEYLST